MTAVSVLLMLLLWLGLAAAAWVHDSLFMSVLPAKGRSRILDFALGRWRVRLRLGVLPWPPFLPLFDLRLEWHADD